MCVSESFSPNALTASFDRESNRLGIHDYRTSRAYFITLVSSQRKFLFGNISDMQMAPSSTGVLISQTWQSLPAHFPAIRLDDFVLMPNHFHAIIWLTPVGAELSSAQRIGSRDAQPSATPDDPVKVASLSTVIQSFKSFSTREINKQQGTPGASIWQRGYHDHIVRNQTDLETIRTYIRQNPLRWHEDELSDACQPLGGA